MKSIIAGSAVFLAVSVAACSGEQDAPPADEASRQALQSQSGWDRALSSLRDFEAASYVDEDAEEADLSAIQGVLPDLVALSWDAKSFDEATGATVFENLRLTVNSEPAFGLAMEEARVWGFDDDLLMARLAGERLDETGVVFDRLEADGYSAFGAAGAMNAAFDVLESEIEAEDASEVDFGVERFDLNVDRTVTGELSLRPFEYVPLSDAQFAGMMGFLDRDMEGEAAESAKDSLKAIQLAQQVIAVGRSIKVERATASNFTMAFDINSDEVDQDLSYTIDFYGLEGLSGYDLDAVYYAGMSQSQGMTMRAPSDEPQDWPYPDGLDIDQVYASDFSVWRNLKLDKLAGYLVRSQFPGMEERDLLSLGSGTVTGFIYRMNEADVLRIKSASVDASEFEWFLPEKISYDLTGMMIRPEEIGQFTLGLMPSGDDEEIEAVRSDIETAVDLLDEHGLADIPVDIQALASWDKETGATRFRLAGQSEGFGERIARLDITIPPYEPMAETVESNEAGSFDAAFEDLFEQYFSFVSARFYESDEGGYDKLFGYLHAIGEQHADQGWGATLAGMPPEDLRRFIATMVRSSKGNVQAQVPQAADWIESLAAYIETPGGSLDIRVEPSEALTVERMDELGALNDDEAIVEQLGISVTHTPE